MSCIYICIYQITIIKKIHNLLSINNAISFGSTMSDLGVSAAQN